MASGNPPDPNSFASRMQPYGRAAGKVSATIFGKGLSQYLAAPGEAPDPAVAQAGADAMMEITNDASRRFMQYEADNFRNFYQQQYEDQMMSAWSEFDQFENQVQSGQMIDPPYRS